MQHLFEIALSATHQLRNAHETLADFFAWPDDLTRQNLAPYVVPAADLVAGFAQTGTPDTQPLINAIRAMARIGNWRHTYSEAEVGADFLSRYGYLELFGPQGHFHSDMSRGFVAYWGNGLIYDWHHHAAEELYVILAGHAEFSAEDQENRWLGPGETCHHLADQPHAMKTANLPVLALVVWRGAGLDGLPKMGRT